MKTRYIAALPITLLVAAPVFAQSDAEIEQQIRALEKKIQHAADVEAVKNLMTSMQYGMAMGAVVQKTPGQCFGQNDGYIYGNFGKRVTRKRAEIAAASGQQGGAPPGFAGGPPGAPPGGPGGAPPGGPGGPPGGPGGSLDFHLLSIPVVEVAEDGMTAKGVWASPGILSEGQPGQYMTAWIWETYASDFVKEDGVWKSWHRTLSTDFMAPPDESWTRFFVTAGSQDEIGRIGGILDSTRAGGQVQEAKPGDEGQPGPPADAEKDIKVVAYRSWSADLVVPYHPRVPVPYTTFEETFSYCPPMPADLKLEPGEEF